MHEKVFMKYFQKVIMIIHFKKINKSRHGHLLYGKCLSESRESKSSFACSKCEFSYHLCEYCFDEFEKNIYFSKSHAYHSFRQFHLANDWLYDGKNCNNDLETKEKFRFKCNTCSDFNLREDCIGI